MRYAPWMVSLCVEPSLYHSQSNHLIHYSITQINLSSAGRRITQQPSYDLWDASTFLLTKQWYHMQANCKCLMEPIDGGAFIIEDKYQVYHITGQEHAAINQLWRVLCIGCALEHLDGSKNAIIYRYCLLDVVCRHKNAMEDESSVFPISSCYALI